MIRTKNPSVDFLIRTRIFFQKILSRRLLRIHAELHRNYVPFFQNSFRDQKFNLKYAFGDINAQGEICNFICAKFDKNFSNELKKNFDKIKYKLMKKKPNYFKFK